MASGLFERHQLLWQRWTDFRDDDGVELAIVTAVNGWALAGGVEIALACDIRIASERARFGSFEVRRGFHHGDGGIVRLVNICGAGIALEMLLTGEPLDAGRALQCNMVSRVVPHESLMAEAEKTAAAILRNDPGLFARPRRPSST
jgi:enoyl-CoA hydratase/carnithine racemase